MILSINAISTELGDVSPLFPVLTRVLGSVGVLHCDDDTLGEEVLVNGNQVLLRHQHDGESVGKNENAVVTI